MRVHNFGIAVSGLRGPFTCPHQELQAECEGISCKCVTVDDSCAAPKFAQRGPDNYSGSRLPGPISLEASTVGAHVLRRSARCDQRLLPVRKQNAKLLRTSQFSSAVHRGPFLRVGYSSEIEVIISQKLISFQAHLRSSKEAPSLIFVVKGHGSIFLLHPQRQRGCLGHRKHWLRQPPPTLLGHRRGRTSVDR